MSDYDYVSNTLEYVYATIGCLGMSYEFIPLLKEGEYTENGLLKLDYDYANRISIKAGMNTEKTSDPDIEYQEPSLKNTRVNVTIQFTKKSIYPYKVKPRDAIDVTIGDTTYRYIVSGNDTGIVTSDIYYSVRATLLSGLTQDYEVYENGTKV